MPGKLHRQIKGSNVEQIMGKMTVHDQMQMLHNIKDKLQIEEQMKQPKNNNYW
jgi:hypothetical protein